MKNLFTEETRIDSDYDALVKANYELHKVSFLGLCETAKSWYAGIDLGEFDGDKNEYNQREAERNTDKYSGMVSNYFYVHKEDDKFYLLDGFNRLFVPHGQIKTDTPVYVKVITDKLSDGHVMAIMGLLNMWKLSNVLYNYNLKTFFDRGMRLFLYKKYNIEIFFDKEIKNRPKHINDNYIIKGYLTYEQDFSGDFTAPNYFVMKVLRNENVINDIRELINANRYLIEPFNNYEMFVTGFATYLAQQRYNDNNTPYKFAEFLDKLYKNKAFFKKLKAMSRNDSTRKNIYHFYRNLDLSK